MWYLKVYILASIAIGVAQTVYKVLTSYRGLIEVLNDENKTLGLAILDQSVTRGHIQKEVFGTRAVFYRKDREGEISAKVASVLDEFTKRHKVICGAMLVFSTLVGDILLWPKNLYDFFADFFVRYNEGSDPKLLKAINSSKNVDELLMVADRMSRKKLLLSLEENDAFLQKATAFKDKLDLDDWDLIWEVAEEGSELEQVASKQINT